MEVVAKGRKNSGLASMTPEKRKEVCSSGGKAVSKNVEHMREIGRKGALARWTKAEEKAGE